MDKIKLFSTKAAFDAEAAQNVSTVAYVDDGTGLKYSGKNVIVEREAAEDGDLAVYDKVAGRIRFIKQGTYNASTFPTNFTKVGVVFQSAGGHGLITALNDCSTSTRWAAGYKVKIEFAFTASGSFELTMSGVSTGTIATTGSTTLTAAVTAINAAITAAASGSAIKNWTVVADTDHNCAIATHNYYSGATIEVTQETGVDVTITDITPAKYQVTASGVVTAVSNLIRKNGVSSYYGGMCFSQFLYYYRNSGVSTANLSLTSADIAKESAFNATDNATIYNAYDGDYEAYIAAHMVRFPWHKGILSKQEDGKVNTTALAAVTYTDIDDTTQPAYPAAASANEFGISVNGVLNAGIEAGNWFLNSAAQQNVLFGKLDRGLTDKINATLTAVGAVNIRPASYNYWTSSESSANGAWYYNPYGNLSNILKNNQLRARATLAF